MNCQDYREWIEDAALGAIAGETGNETNSSRRTQLDAHLAACPECRREFEAAQKLYLGINRGVVASVEGVPSVDFAARVRMRLDAEGERAQLRWWRRSIWIPALGSAALALLLLIFWTVRRPIEQRPRAPKQQIARTLVAPKPGSPASVRPAEPADQARVVRPLAAASVPRRSQVSSARQSRQGESMPDSGAPQLQVQIQPGQWAAITSLYRAGQSGKVNETAKDVPADQPLQVTPVEVPPLVVAELQDPQPVGSEPESTNIQDR